MVYVRMVNTQRTLCNFVSRVYSSYPGAKEMSVGTKSDIQCSAGNQGAKYLN